MFQGLNQLYSIDLQGNRLEFVEPLGFANLPGLRHLDISYNQLRTLPDSTFQGTFMPVANERRVIYACGNYLSMWWLFIFSMIGNPWVCDSALEWFRQLLRDNLDIVICYRLFLMDLCFARISISPDVSRHVRAVRAVVYCQQHRYAVSTRAPINHRKPRCSPARHSHSSDGLFSVRDHPYYPVTFCLQQSSWPSYWRASVCSHSFATVSARVERSRKRSRRMRTKRVSCRRRHPLISMVVHRWSVVVRRRIRRRLLIWICHPRIHSMIDQTISIDGLDWTGFHAVICVN